MSLLNSTQEGKSLYPKLPSFRQFCEEIPKIKYEEGVTPPVKYLVEFVWLPGKWKNYTFQTTSFNLRITEDSELYEELELELEEWSELGIALCIQVLDSSDCTFSFTVFSEHEKCAWKPLGSKGFKLEDFKSTQKNQRTAKTRSTTKKTSRPASDV